MPKKIKIDKSIVLPDTCDDMPNDLRQHLLAALTDASDRLKCHYKELRWGIEMTGSLPIISVRKAT